MKPSSVSIILQAERPRNVNTFQAASILYGDWGTSKAYVIGLAFAIAGYSSFWLILAVSLLCAFVGINYITICKYYPNGGGVYASVRNRSEILALVGGFFLLADYIVTASLSALAAYSYLGVHHPVQWALGTIILIGLLNFFGPRSSGNVAFIITIPTFIVVCILGYLSLFHIEDAVKHVQPLEGGFLLNWTQFVSVIVALSGIEAIANTTGVMKLDPGSTYSKPSVLRTSTPAIIIVMLEVCIFTTLFALVVNALPGLVRNGLEVSAPGYPDVRDSMLRYMGEVFGGNLWGPHAGQLLGYAISIVFFALLLSAVNTAMMALISLLYVMSIDGEMPSSFQKINRWGVPTVPLLIATIAPFIVLASVGDVAGLAQLYAVGFVGAIATNLGATSTNPKLDLKLWERVMMFGTFLIMAAIEITLFIDKPSARAFVISILAIGLLLRGLVIERRKKRRSKTAKPEKYPIVTDLAKELLQESATGQPEVKLTTKQFSKVHGEEEEEALHMHMGAILCATTHVGKTLEFAVEECLEQKQHLYLLFIREQKVIPEDPSQNWEEDVQARQISEFLKKQLSQTSFTFLYTVTTSPAEYIAQVSEELKISRVILGQPRHNRLMRMLQGDIVRQTTDLLPTNIDVIIVS
jgi:amino acid transporter